MPEIEGDDPKVRQLFPIKRSSAPEDVQSQIRDLLQKAVPEPETSPPEIVVPSTESDGPEEGHPNAVECPQCFRRTWKATQHCMHCKFDLWQFWSSIENDRRRRFQQDAREKSMRITWVLGFGGLAVMQIAQWMPQQMKNTLYVVGLLAIFASVVIFKLGGQ